MATMLANDLCSTKDCWGVSEKIALRIIVRADDWTAERAIIASNVKQ